MVLTTILLFDLLIHVAALTPYVLRLRALLGGVGLAVLFASWLSCFSLGVTLGATGTTTTLHFVQFKI